DTATVSTGSATPPGTLTVLGGGAQSYGGSVTGNGTITYAGNGSLGLYGASNTYTGKLVAQSGTLVVSADFSVAPAQVGGGTLGGSGVVQTIAGTAGVVNPGGVLTALAGPTVALAGLTYQVDL